MNGRHLRLDPEGCVVFGKLAERKRDTGYLGDAAEVNLSTAEGVCGGGVQARVRGCSHGCRMPGCPVWTRSNRE